ncbi:MAG: HD domain-containing protein [Anaerolineales bacterium]
MDAKKLLAQILSEYSLPVLGVHGVAHWARVLENGRRLASLTGADLEIIELFALLHDSRRRNEAIDPGHGRRGAEFARRLRGSLIELDDARFELLAEACTRHTEGLTEGEVTLQTCWDADRLDLFRVAIRPAPARLCTHWAQDPKMLEWAIQRSLSGRIPSLVEEEWGLRFGAESRDQGVG